MPKSTPPLRLDGLPPQFSIFNFQFAIFNLLSCPYLAGSLAFAAEGPPSTDDQLRDSLNSKAGDDYDRELLGDPAKPDGKGRVDEEMQKKLQKELGPAAEKEGKPKDCSSKSPRRCARFRRGSDQRDSGAVTQHVAAANRLRPGEIDRSGEEIGMLQRQEVPTAASLRAVAKGSRRTIRHRHPGILRRRPRQAIRKSASPRRFAPRQRERPASGCWSHSARDCRGTIASTCSNCPASTSCRSTSWRSKTISAASRKISPTRGDHDACFTAPQIGLPAPPTLAVPAAAQTADPEKTAAEMIKPAAQKAIDQGLQWLASRQNDDGGFGLGTQRGNAAICGLCGMAFMSGGSTPGRGPYGATCRPCRRLPARHRPAQRLHRRADADDPRTDV